MEHPFIKLHIDYYDDVVLSTLDDAHEVMFTRGLAYCGGTGTGGLILTSKLMGLTRKTSLAQAKRLADRLCMSVTLDTEEYAGPWTKVAGGYQVRNWSVYQDQLDALEQRRKSDRDRKRRSRDKDTGQSRDTSRPESRDVTPTEIEVEVETAAAARETSTKIPVDDLPPAVMKLRDRFATLTVLHLVSFAELTPAWLAKLEPLIERHGVDKLTDTANRTQRPIGGVNTVQGFIKTWDHLAAPRAVADPDAAKCPECHLPIADCDRKSKTDPEFCPRTESA